MKRGDLLTLLISAVVTTVGMTWIKLLAPAAVSYDVSALVKLVGAAGIYFSGLGIWLWVLGRNEMSVVYPVGISLSLLLSTSTGFIFLGEPPTALRLAGIAAVLTGVALVAGDKNRNGA